MTHFEHLVFVVGLSGLWGMYCGWLAHLFKQSPIANAAAALFGVILILRCAN